MRGTIIWDNDDKTILRHIYPVTFRSEDVAEVARVTYSLLVTVPHIVHLIVELTALSRAVQVQIMEAAADLEEYVAPNQGFAVTVGGGLAMAYAVKSMAKVAPRAMQNAYFADTVEEARDMIKKLTSRGEANA